MNSQTHARDQEILIAEDSATQSAQLVHLLERRGFRVTAARNGREAVERLESSRPAMVITDVVMPEMDGYTLCRTIKGDERWHQIPVMLVTTLSDPTDVIRGLECGADNFVRKPYEERDLLSRVEYLLMNHELRRSQKIEMGIEIRLGGVRHFITSNRQQILDLLISTYEQAVQISDELRSRESDLARGNQVLNGLYRIAEGLNRASTEREVAELALGRAVELPGIRAGWIILREGEKGFMVAATRNLPPALLAPGVLEGDCLCRRLALSGDLDAVARIVECERLQQVRGEAFEFQAHTSVALWVGDRILGVMNLVGPDGAVFEEEEMKILHNIGNQMALALDRARLRERLEALVEERTATLNEEIARRRLIEEDLRNSEERYRLLFDRNPHPSWVYDEGTLAFLAVNQAAVQQYGYSRDEFLGITIKDIRPPQDVADLMQVLREHPEDTTPRTFGVFRHRRKDGSTLEVEISSAEIHFAGRAAGLVLAVDVTERRRIEEQLLRMQRMESIGTLAGGMAHDLNNLLMPVMMGTALLRRSQNEGQRLKAIESIERSAARARDLIGRVLSFAKGVEGARVAVQPGDLIREMESILENTFPKDVSLQTDVPEEVWAILGDPIQLIQVLMNLCVNARDAMPEGGRISITAKNVEIDEHYARMHPGMSAGPYVVLEVADTGEGIPPKILDRIFEPFFTTKDVGTGTGLGLSTVVAIVRGHGGYVNVYSEPGRGSLFKVFLPARREAEEEPATRSENASLPRGDGEMILVVDDEASILAITRQTLERFGYRVLTTGDGAEAIGLYALHCGEIGAVITDMAMPVMDGATLIAALRGIEPEVKVIASSGFDPGGKVAESERAGVVGFLHKPYSAEVLLNTLARVLGKSEPR
ncbi:MAG TPA: response regulator [Thermoanaerobaculia bacterium]|nr:response regulator [Thermoanaerobaculia bacterium]